jgi:serine/threonine protein kinase
MHDPPAIQKLSPSYVVKVLIPQPYGTYIVRAETSNDVILSCIRINNRSTTSTRHHYVVLSVRVDETLYTSPIMNYRLALTEENQGKLLEQYNSQRNKLRKLTPLKRELLLSIERPNWSLDLKQFDDFDFSKSRFGGKNNNGVSEAIWIRPGKDNIKTFIKRFEKTNCYFENELTLLKQLCFFPIISLYGQYSDNEYNYLVFSHGGKSLQSICPLQASTNRLKMFRITKIAFQIANAMIYLEKKNIVHRDLTASNVLIDDKGFIRIADFGHAIQKEEGKNNLSRSLTNNGEEKFQIRFLAPECIIKPSQSQTDQSKIHDRRQIYASFSSKSDVWAFGILLIQLMLKDPSKPYPHINNDRDIPQRIVINREIHSKPNECNIDIYYILQRCWAYQPINRISFTEIREKMNMLATIFN